MSRRKSHAAGGQEHFVFGEFKDFIYLGPFQFKFISMILGFACPVA